MSKLNFIGNKEDVNAINFLVEKLPNAEHCGDWHDKPLKWIAKCTTKGKEMILTQKFQTRKSAEKWARIVRQCNGDFQAASNKFTNYFLQL